MNTFFFWFWKSLWFCWILFQQFVWKFLLFKLISPLPWRAPCIYRHERPLERLMKEFGKAKRETHPCNFLFFAVNSALSLLILHYKDVAWFCIHSRGFPFVHKKESFIFVSLWQLACKLDVFARGNKAMCFWWLIVLCWTVHYRCFTCALPLVDFLLQCFAWLCSLLRGFFFVQKRESSQIIWGHQVEGLCLARGNQIMCLCFFVWWLLSFAKQGGCASRLSIHLFPMCCKCFLETRSFTWEHHSPLIIIPFVCIKGFENICPKGIGPWNHFMPCLACVWISHQVHYRCTTITLSLKQISQNQRKKWSVEWTIKYGVGQNLGYDSCPYLITFHLRTCWQQS